VEALRASREIMAPADWQRIDFISDLHLAEDTPKGFNAWRGYLLNTTADAVFILGDLFEAWVGDDARFEGFEARGDGGFGISGGGGGAVENGGESAGGVGVGDGGAGAAEAVAEGAQP